MSTATSPSATRPARDTAQVATQGKAEGRAERKDVVRNRARLLEAADELVAQHGVNFGLDAVARHAGVGAGTVYRHFPDKAALLAALLARRVDTVERLLQHAAEAPDAYQALREYVLTIVELQTGDLGMWQAVAVTSGEGPEQVRTRLEPLFERLVARAQSTGRLRPEFTSTDLVMLTWTAGAINERLGASEPAIWNRYLVAMLDGFASDSEVRQPLPVPALSQDRLVTVLRAWLPTAQTL